MATFTKAFFKGLWKSIDKIEPDVLFLHGIGDFKDFILWKKKKPYKIVRDCHMSWIASRNRLRKIYYGAFKLIFSKKINESGKYEVIYALGDEEYEYLTKLGICKNKIEFLRHGYNSSAMYYDKEARDQVRSKYGFGKEDIVVSYIGKFDYFKRPDIIFVIFDQIEIQFIQRYNIKLLYIGSKDLSYMRTFNTKLQNHQNQINIIVDDAKPFSDLRKYFSASDICIFPKETTLSSIHAQVCSCPVIMEKHKSNVERVINNNNLYEIDNYQQAANIIKRIVAEGEYVKSNIVNKDLEPREYSNQIKKIQSLA